MDTNDQKILESGKEAQEILNHRGFSSTFQESMNAVVAGILGSSLDQKDIREALYCQGKSLSAFVESLENKIKAAKAVEERLAAPPSVDESAPIEDIHEE